LKIEQLKIFFCQFTKKYRCWIPVPGPGKT